MKRAEVQVGTLAALRPAAAWRDTPLRWGWHALLLMQLATLATLLAIARALGAIGPLDGLIGTAGHAAPSALLGPGLALLAAMAATALVRADAPRWRLRAGAVSGAAIALAALGLRAWQWMPLAAQGGTDAHAAVQLALLVLHTLFLAGAAGLSLLLGVTPADSPVRPVLAAAATRQWTWVLATALVLAAILPALPGP